MGPWGRSGCPVRRNRSGPGGPSGSHRAVGRRHGQVVPRQPRWHITPQVHVSCHVTPQRPAEWTQPRNHGSRVRCCAWMDIHFFSFVPFLALIRIQYIFLQKKCKINQILGGEKKKTLQFLTRGSVQFYFHQRNKQWNKKDAAHRETEDPLLCQMSKKLTELSV